MDALFNLLERRRRTGDQDDMGARPPRASAVAAPMPRLAPVTSASLPEKIVESVMKPPLAA